MENIEKVELAPLSDRHHRVLEHYLMCWNQTEAYCRVYDVDRKSAGTLAARLFNDPNFQAHLQIHLNDMHMSAAEALKLTSDIARSDLTKVVDPLGDDVMKQIQESGNGRLLKKLRRKTTTTKEGSTETTYEFEMYNAQEAQRDILKINGKFPENSQRGNGGATPPAGSVTMDTTALMSLVDILEKRRAQDQDKARAIDGQVSDNVPTE